MMLCSDQLKIIGTRVLLVYRQILHLFLSPPPPSFLSCICLLCRSPNTLILSRSGLMGICDISIPLKIKTHKGILVVGPCATPTTTIARSSRNPALVWWYVPETAPCLMGQSFNFGLLSVIRLDKSNKVRIRGGGGSEPCNSHPCSCWGPSLLAKRSTKPPFPDFKIQYSFTQLLLLKNRNSKLFINLFIHMHIHICQILIYNRHLYVTYNRGEVKLLARHEPCGT